MANASQQPSPEQLAEQVASQITQQGGSLDPAYTAFDLGIAQFQQSGLPLDSLIPAGEHAMGFSLRRATDGKSFWDIYGTIVRNKLCTANSDLNDVVRHAVQSGTTSLIAIVMQAMALPATAILIGATIAGIIASLGLDAFCEYTKPADVAPQH
ncbi:MAG TPA: hypothetical protein VHX63_03715 [Acidobacteriaceae bacterium]|jgi:hypothetical protein|nr:hypothetical protein [Acidobacteriaceae bacterium]